MPQLDQSSLLKNLSLFAALSAVSILCGCATVLNDSSQPLRIETVTVSGQSIKGADCKLTNDHGSITMKSGDISPVHRSGADLQIDCSMVGRADANGRAVSRANAGMAGNIIAGGIIGAVIDHSKGTAYSYPSWLQLVFGETRLYDRRSESDGQPLRGVPVSGINTVSESGAPSYASIDDLTRLPYSSSKMVERYQVFLSRPLPRAFAISDAGDWRMAWGDRPKDRNASADPSERAIALCERETGRHCVLYAVNNRVVYQPPASAGVSDSAAVPEAKVSPPTPPE